MITGIDHVVILVQDLSAATDSYESLGFTVVPGGEHADGRSHNSLIAFEDGTYLELIAFKGEALEQHPFYRPGRTQGLITFALLPEDIGEDLARIRSRGLEMDGPREGGRLRPDGRQVSWRSAWPRTYDLPFLCADVTPRDLRVPTGSARQHANGASGVSGIIVGVRDLRASTRRYAALPGSGTPVAGVRGATFPVGTSNIVLRTAPPGEMEGPHSLALRGPAGSVDTDFDESSTHGVRLSIVGEPMKVSGVDEEYAHVGTLRCNHCGGSYGAVRQSLVGAGTSSPRDVLSLKCRNCGSNATVTFDISSFFNK